VDVLAVDVGGFHVKALAAFGKPTKVVNDAAMQALGSYDRWSQPSRSRRPPSDTLRAEVWPRATSH
jgi:hypothetical protein